MRRLRSWWLGWLADWRLARGWVDVADAMDRWAAHGYRGHWLDYERLAPHEVAQLRNENALRRQTVIVQRNAIRRNQETIRLQRQAIADLTAKLVRSETRRLAAERQLREVDG